MGEEEEGKRSREHGLERKRKAVGNVFKEGDEKAGVRNMIGKGKGKIEVKDG